MTLGQIYKNGANRLAAASGARDCPMCTTQYLVPWLEDSANWLLSGFLGARLLKIIGLSGGPSMQRSTVGLRPQSEDSLRRQVAPDCPVIFSGRAPRIPKSGQFAECSSQGTGQSGAPLAAASLFCSKHVELSHGHFLCMCI